MDIDTLNYYILLSQHKTETLFSLPMVAYCVAMTTQINYEPFDYKFEILRT